MPFRFGADYSESSGEVLIAETVTLHSTSDISLVWHHEMVEREVCRRLEQNFEEDSNVSVHSIINLVFVLRGFSNRSNPSLRQRGRQIALF